MARPQFDAPLVVWWVNLVGPLLTPSVKFRLFDKFSHQIKLKKLFKKSFLHFAQVKQLFKLPTFGPV